MPSLRALWVVLGSLLIGCTGTQSHEHRPEPRPLTELKLTARYEGTYPIRVVATTGLVADLVREIAGPHVEVTELMGPRIDPHLYKPTPQDVSKLAAADMVFYSGLHLEGKMGEYLDRIAETRPVVPVAEYIDVDRLLESSETTYDPHIWFDAQLWADAGLVVGVAFSQFDPAHADDYTTRATVYHDELMELDGTIREQLAAIPKDRRVLVTAHDAFQYFGRAYDVEVRGIQGVSTESEAGLHEIESLVQFLVERKIPAVFVETSVNDSRVRSLIDGAQAQGHAVKIAEPELYSDALGEADTPAGTYRGMMKENVATITAALQ